MSVWPSELDLMARLAGMTLQDRWSDWHRTPFTSESPSHVSVWEKGPQPALGGAQLAWIGDSWRRDYGRIFGACGDGEGRAV